MERILGVFCLTSLQFFLGVFFLGEEQLHILLCFFQFLHFIPCLTVGWICCFLLRKQCSVFGIQFFYLWQLFQIRFVKSGFCRLVQRDLFPVFFQKLLAVPSLTVGIRCSAALMESPSSWYRAVAAFTRSCISSMLPILFSCKKIRVLDISFRL